MKMYSGSEVRYIIEEFLAEHFNLDSLSLKADSIMKLRDILDNYGIEVENIQKNND